MINHSYVKVQIFLRNLEICIFCVYKCKVENGSISGSDYLLKAAKGQH